MSDPHPSAASVRERLLERCRRNGPSFVTCEEAELPAHEWCVLCEAAFTLAAAEQRAEQAEAERDLERSRFAHYADRFGDLAYELDRRAGSDWGHLRAMVLATTRDAVKQFRSFASGQLSPYGFRLRAEAAEATRDAQAAEIVRLRAALTEILKLPRLFDAVSSICRANDIARNTLAPVPEDGSRLSEGERKEQKA